MDAQTQSTDRYLTTVQWLHDRRKPLMVAGAVLVVLGLVWAFWSWNSSRKDTEANDAFFAAPLESGLRSLAVTPTALLDVAADYPSTAAGEHALALAAEQLFTQGKYPEALKQFSEFIETYPDSPLIAQAKVGQAACLEAEGKTSEAIAKYREIISLYPSEMSIVGPAKLTLARLYEESNQLQQAFTYYAELARILTQNPNDPWASEARERAQLLAATHPELMKALAGSSPGAPQNAPFNSDSLEAPDLKPAKAPVTRATNAAKTSTPASPASNQVPNLLTIPGVSTNSNSKP